MNNDKLWPKYPKDSRISDVHPEDVLVDHLEGELDDEFEKDLEIWLNGSEGIDSNIKDEMEMLNQLRKSLKNSDDVAIPEDGAYYDRLEARILSSLDHAIESGDVRDRAQVAQVEGKKARGVLPALLERAYVSHGMRSAPRGMAARAGHFAALAGLALLMAGKWPFPLDGTMTRDGSVRSDSRSKSDVLRATREAVPAVLSDTVLTFESNGDLAMDLLARENVQRLLANNTRKFHGQEGLRADSDAP